MAESTAEPPTVGSAGRPSCARIVRAAGRVRRPVPLPGAVIERLPFGPLGGRPL